MKCINCPLCLYEKNPLNGIYERYCAVTGYRVSKSNACSRTNKFILAQDSEKLITDWRKKAEKIVDDILKEIEVNLYVLLKNMDNQKR